MQRSNFRVQRWGDVVISTLRNRDAAAPHIDYCLHIIGIRVWTDECQLIAKTAGTWLPIGPKRQLPVHIPEDYASLQPVEENALEVTAWQYAAEHHGTNIRAVLSKHTLLDEALAAEGTRLHRPKRSTRRQARHERPY